MSRVEVDPLVALLSAANLFSVMTPSRTALAHDLLRSIPARLRQNGMLQLSEGSSVLTTGAALTATDQKGNAPVHAAASSSAWSQPGDEANTWRERLLHGELLPGKVIELCVTGPSLGTSVALSACRTAQQRARHDTGQTAFCAFVDSSASLYAPGVHASGVELQRLLVVRPEPESLSRVTLRLVESKFFPLVVVDLMILPGSDKEIALATWVRVVRRLSLALENTQNTVVLLTEKHARRPLCLPVAQRIELSRTSHQEMRLGVPKSTQGAFLPPTRVRMPPELLHAERPAAPRWSHAG